MTSVGVASVLAALLLALAATFQGALALGAPWGAMAYGGRATRADGTISVRYRVLSAFTILVLALAGWSLHRGSDPVLWTLAALFGGNTAANLAARHPIERWGMSAITLGLTGCYVTLAVA